MLVMNGLISDEFSLYVVVLNELVGNLVIEENYLQFIIGVGIFEVIVFLVQVEYLVFDYVFFGLVLIVLGIDVAFVCNVQVMLFWLVVFVFIYVYEFVDFDFVFLLLFISFFYGVYYGLDV